jgi:hypothetical protein
MNHIHHNYIQTVSNVTESLMNKVAYNDDESQHKIGEFHRQMVFHFGYKEVILFDFWQTNTMFSEFSSLPFFCFLFA